MNARESKALKVGAVVLIQEDHPTDKIEVRGQVIETGYNAVKIKWDDGQIGCIHHNDMRDVSAVVNCIITINDGGENSVFKMLCKAEDHKRVVCHSSANGDVWHGELTPAEVEYIKKFYDVGITAAPVNA